MTVNHSNTHLVYRQSGITLIEIAVSVFILSLGILALLGMQTRSLNTIKQAQNIAQVSQAVDNLAQGLTINPQLKLELNDVKGYVTKKDYSAYKFEGCEKVSDAEWMNVDSNLNHNQLASQQLRQFCREIRQISGISPDEIQLKICTNSSTQGNLPWGFRCEEKGHETVVKVVWKYRTQTDSENGLNSEVIDSDNKIILSYEVPLTE